MVSNLYQTGVGAAKSMGNKINDLKYKSYFTFINLTWHATCFISGITDHADQVSRHGAEIGSLRNCRPQHSSSPAFPMILTWYLGYRNFLGKLEKVVRLSNFFNLLEGILYEPKEDFRSDIFGSSIRSSSIFGIHR